MDMTVEIGKRIKEQRLLYHLSSEALAEKIDISSGFMGLVERGQRGLSIANLVKVCKIFNITLDYLILGTQKDAVKYKKDFNCFFNEVLYESEQVFLVEVCKIIIPCKFSENELVVLKGTLNFQAKQIDKIKYNCLKN